MNFTLTKFYIKSSLSLPNDSLYSGICSVFIFQNSVLGGDSVYMLPCESTDYCQIDFPFKKTM